jgi:PAS domain S-box-containing protein
MDYKSLNTPTINADFYKLQQDYNTLKQLFDTISEKNQFNENKIDHINERLTESLENMSDAFVAIDNNWEYTFVNQKALLILGKNIEDLIGKSLWDVFPAAIGTHYHKVFYEAMTTKKQITFEYYYLPWDSWIENRIVPSKLGLVVFFQDITERKLVESKCEDLNSKLKIRNRELYDSIIQIQNINTELIFAKEKAEESDHLKSAFLANISHEIRTPMNGILGFTELLKEPKLTGRQKQEYIRVIEKSGSRMLNIINDIVSISKIESGQISLNFRETSLKNQIQFLTDIFKLEVEGKNIELKLINTLNDEDCIIITDEEKVCAILSQLLKNAIKFTDYGSIEIGCIKNKDTITFYVKDSGIGINTNQIDLLFERFRQEDDSLRRNSDGAGLGLYIAKTYVDLLGGKIWGANNAEKGAIFYFEIPLIRPNEVYKESQIPMSTITNETPRLKILVAEDDSISLKFISKILEVFGENLLVARNGLEAVNICKNNPDIDIVLMDIQMPVMNGYEAIKKIREFNQEVIVIIQSAFVFTDEAEKAIEVGGNGYISKPINKDLLIDHINNQIIISKHKYQTTIVS